jgi:hypothetical protein
VNCLTIFVSSRPQCRMLISHQVPQNGPLIEFPIRSRRRESWIQNFPPVDRSQEGVSPSHRWDETLREWHTTVAE